MLKESGKIKNVLGNTQFTLEAKANESFRIRDIFIANPAAEYATLRTNKTVVGYFRTGTGTLGNHLHYPIEDQEEATLLSKLIGMGLFHKIPVPSGSVFTIENIHDAGSTVTVIYDEYDASDVSPAEINGENAKEYDLINYGRFSGTLAAGDNLYETQQTSNAYPAFPFGKVVPSKHVMTLYGVLFSDFSRTSGTAANKCFTKFLKVVKNRKTLYDDDFNGFPYIGSALAADGTEIGEGISRAGNFDDIDLRLPLILDEPIVFNPGDDVDLYVNTIIALGVANIAAKDAEVGLIFNVKLI